MEDLQAEGFVRPFNPPLTEDNTPVVVQIPDLGEREDTSYHISRGLVMDDLAPTIEEVHTLITGRSTPPYRNASMPSPTIPVVTGTSSLVSGLGLTQASGSAFLVSFGLGTGTTGMSSTGLFSLTPIVVNLLTQSDSSAITFQGLPWNFGQVPPLVPTFETGPAHNSGSVSGFNPILGPQVQTGGFMSSIASTSSTHLSLFAGGSTGMTPLVRSSMRGQYIQTHFNQTQGSAY